MVKVNTDLPFKVGRHAIVVVRDTPVLECSSCPEYLISDSDMARIEQVLVARSPSTELEVVSFAA
jgi:YgiT-type zinc finger domain-containing protein